MAVIAAGPFSNFLLALVLLCAGYVAGWPVLSSQIGKVMEDGPAMQAGLKEGDRVLAVDGIKVRRWEEMRSLISGRPGEEMVLTINRDGREDKIQVTPKISDQKDMFGKPVGLIGITPSGDKIELGFFEAIYEGCRFTFRLTGLVLETLVKLVTLEISAKALGGPIMIVQASGESLKAGVFSFLFLMSYISINLAIINLLPVPILDGGHLLFFTIEAIIRRPVTGRVREIATQVGILFIIFLLVLVVYNDVSRIVTKGWGLQP